MMLLQEGIQAPGQWDGGAQDDGGRVSWPVAAFFIAIIAIILAYNVMRRKD